MNRNGCVTFCSFFFFGFGKPTCGCSGYVYQVHVQQTNRHTHGTNGTIYWNWIQHTYVYGMWMAMVLEMKMGWQKRNGISAAPLTYCERCNTDVQKYVCACVCGPIHQQRTVTSVSYSEQLKQSKRECNWAAIRIRNKYCEIKPFELSQCWSNPLSFRLGRGKDICACLYRDRDGKNAPSERGQTYIRWSTSSEEKRKNDCVCDWEWGRHRENSVRSYNECCAMPIARVAYTNDDGWIILAGIGVKSVQCAVYVRSFVSSRT